MQASDWEALKKNSGVGEFNDNKWMNWYKIDTNNTRSHTETMGNYKTNIDLTCTVGGY